MRVLSKNFMLKSSSLCLLNVAAECEKDRALSQNCHAADLDDLVN